jgi:hypothetical protein
MTTLASLSSKRRWARLLPMKPAPPVRRIVSGIITTDVHTKPAITGSPLVLSDGRNYVFGGRKFYGIYLGQEFFLTAKFAEEVVQRLRSAVACNFYG